MTFKSQRGQSMVLTLVFLTVLLGMAAAVIDVGGWYRAHRQTQSTADATALAGAQVLPHTGNASTLALDYASRNGGGVNSGDVSFTSDRETNDTIHVTARKNVPGLFTKLLGISSVNARSVSAARMSPMTSAKYAAPIGVDYRHDKLHCNPALVCNPEFGVDTVIDFNKVGPGAFKLINIDSSHGGVSPKTLGDWMLNGLDAYMDVNKWYYSDPGMKPNSANFQTLWISGSARARSSSSRSTTTRGATEQASTTTSSAGPDSRSRATRSTARRTHSSTASSSRSSGKESRASTAASPTLVRARSS